MAKKFTWTPDIGAGREVAPIVNVTQFGDGYELRTASQINVNKRKWSLTFTSNLAGIKPAVAFLDEHQGRISFDFTDPWGEDGTYVCRNWSSRQTKFGIYELTATFEEVFEP